jgi:hypothetical protein
MPRISQFYGVIIFMDYNDHLPPHFHAEYAEHEAIYIIDTLDILRGELPRRAHSMVVEWALAHRAELRDNWDRARARIPLLEVQPLD